MDHEGLIRRLREVPPDHPRRSEAMLDLFQEWLDAGAEWSRDESAWLIETKMPTGQPCYWGGPALWTTDHLKAIRFARKLDGERVAEDMDTEGLAVIEHMWSSVKLGE